jgi:hypothetical protein
VTMTWMRMTFTFLVNIFQFSYQFRLTPICFAFCPSSFLYGIVFCREWMNLVVLLVYALLTAQMIYHLATDDWNWEHIDLSLKDLIGETKQDYLGYLTKFRGHPNWGGVESQPVEFSSSLTLYRCLTRHCYRQGSNKERGTRCLHV